MGLMWHLKITNALVPIPSNVELMGMKPCSLNDVIYMVKELEYTVPQVPNPKVYYLIYLLQKVFHNRICSIIVGNYDKLDDFEQMWKIKIYRIQTSKKVLGSNSLVCKWLLSQTSTTKLNLGLLMIYVLNLLLCFPKIKIMTPRIPW